MDRDFRITREHLFYGVVFFSALLIRFVFLGRASLLDGEGFWAYQAWQLSDGEILSMGSRVGYLAFTGGLFSLFGSSDFLARFWSAFTGSLVVWIPFILRKNVKPIPALIAAVGLALDPTLVGGSRLVGGPIPSFVFLGLALAAFHTLHISWAVFFVGLGLLSGPDFWMGLLLIGAGFLVGRVVGVFDIVDYFRSQLSAVKLKYPDLKTRWLLPLLLVVLLATSMLSNFQGLTAWAGAFPEFLTSWLLPEASPLKLLLALLISNPFGLLFGILGFISSWRSDNQSGKLFSIWFGVILALLLVYPNRQPVDLIWAAIPLWFAAAGEVVRIIRFSRTFWVTYILAGVVAVLLTLNWLTFIGLVFQAGSNRAALLQLGLLAASLMLVILSMVIVSSEWDWATAWKGLAFGVGCMLIMFMISSLSLDGFIREKDPRSLFTGERGSGQMDLMRESIADVSLTATGRPDSIQGVVVRGSDLLRWELRDFPGIVFADVVDSQTPAPLLITTSVDAAGVDGETYRGQDFVFTSQPGWDGILPPDWISWIAFRHGPVIHDYLVLWIRNDINSGY
jgi:hypothetical protein